MRILNLSRLHLRVFPITALAICGIGTSVAAAVPGQIDFSSSESVSRWIANYRSKPEPTRLPQAVRALSQQGVFKEVESSGAYVGFIAGVIGANPARAEELIGKMLPIPTTDQWAIVRAIAYSGHSDWKELLRNLSYRLPARRVMIEKHLAGDLPTLDHIPLEQKGPSMWQKVFGSEKDPKKAISVTFDRNPELLDTLWGYYFATGSYGPIARIIELLPWSNDRDSVDKLTVGNMAKYTLASNATRDAELLSMLKNTRANRPRDVTLALEEVIEAAETMEVTRLRKDALASIEELKRKGPGYKRDVSMWGQVGQGALALGCIAAAAVGQVAVGIPCVVGGAASSAALTYWGNH
jgi:hypothetical protein